MVGIRIPPGYRRGISKLLALSDEVFEVLARALAESPLLYYDSDLVLEVKKRVDAIPSDDIESIVKAARSIEYVRAVSDTPLDRFLPEIAASVKALRLASSSIDDDEISARLQTLLKSPSLSVPSKARSLLAEGHSFCRAKVLTDIRPVFGPEEEPVEPQAAVVVHSLRISYHDGPKTRDLIVTMDSDDIDTLMGSLHRAKLKEERLESLLKRADVPFIDSD